MMNGELGVQEGLNKSEWSVFFEILFGSKLANEPLKTTKIKVLYILK